MSVRLTPIERTAAIRDLFSNNLPDLLTDASLDNFDEYLNKSPLRSQDKELCVYIDFDDNDSDSYSFGVVIQAQLYGSDQVQEYHSVIMKFIEENIIGDTVGFTVRNNIAADIWPMDIERSTAFIYYSVGFMTRTDDCDQEA